MSTLFQDAQFAPVCDACQGTGIEIHKPAAHRAPECPYCKGAGRTFDTVPVKFVVTTAPKPVKAKRATTKQDTLSFVMLGASAGLFVGSFFEHSLLPFSLSFAIASQVTGRKNA